MKRNQPSSKPRRTAKQRVMRKYPEARECYTRRNEKAIGVGLNRILGLGKTWEAAWADAARWVS